MKPIVAKVGGSLFDLPDLRERLWHWCSGFAGREIYLVPGGGAAAKVIRQLDAIHRLGEKTSHRLALAMMSVNACFLEALLPSDARSSVIPFDVAAWQPPTDLEHSWRVTSDTIAAALAHQIGGEIWLLKSVDLPAGCTWHEASAAGLVDAAFPEWLERHPVPVNWNNLRSANVLAGP